MTSSNTGSLRPVAAVTFLNYAARGLTFPFISLYLVAVGFSGVQIGIVRDTLPHANFQIPRQPDRPKLAISPFRLGEQPNVRVGVAMITSAPEAIALHEQTAEELWGRALKGRDAAAFARAVIRRHAA